MLLLRMSEVTGDSEVKVKKVLLLVMAVLWGGVPISAQSIPQYNGVYVRLDDGELFELRPYDFSNIRLRVTSPTNSPNRLQAVHRYFPEWTARIAPCAEQDSSEIFSVRASNIQHLPLLEGHPSRIQSIVVRSRDPSFVFMNQMITLEELRDNLQSSCQSFGTVISIEGEWMLMDGLTGVLGEWGWNPDGFRELILDNFTTEYIPRNERFAFGVRGFSDPRDPDNTVMLPTAGIVLETADGRFGLRFDD